MPANISSNDFLKKIEQPPSWQIRYGLSLIFLILIVVIFFLGFYKYSEKASFPVTFYPNTILFKIADTSNFSTAPKISLSDTLEKSVLKITNSNRFIINSASKELTDYYIASIDTTITIHGYIPRTERPKFYPNQRVRIVLENFPEQDFGHINAIIKSIDSIINNQGSYACLLILPNGLLTNHNKKLDIISLQPGIANIQVEKTSVLKALFGKVLGL